MERELLFEFEDVGDDSLLDDFYKAQAAVDEAIDRVRELKEQLKQTAIQTGYRFSDCDESYREKLYRYFYWVHTDIPSSWIGAGLGFKPNSPKVRGSVKVNIPCKRCGEPLIANSRTELDTIFNHYHFPLGGHHDKCIQDYHRERRAQQIAETNNTPVEIEKRLLELKEMPYREYLQTPEWNERRKKSLRRAGYRCQLCNRNDLKLHVHHRTYERRGSENDGDLIVLCELDHAKFHDK